jgi:hypothetical protein
LLIKSLSRYFLSEFIFFYQHLESGYFKKNFNEKINFSSMQK